MFWTRELTLPQREGFKVSTCLCSAVVYMIPPTCGEILHKSSVYEIRHIMGQAGMWKNFFPVIPKVTSWCLQLAQTFCQQQQNSDPEAQQSVLESDLLLALLPPQLPRCGGKSGIEGGLLSADLQPFGSPLLSPCRYCGERSQFVVASTTNKIELRFHSDQSYTDTGFSAEFLSYDSSDRELKPWGWGGEVRSGAPLCLYCSVNWEAAFSRVIGACLSFLQTSWSSCCVLL